MRSVNLKLPPADLDSIDAAVQLRNRDRPPGSPPWSRTSFLLSAALAQVEGDRLNRETRTVQMADGERVLGPVAPHIEAGAS